MRKPHLITGALLAAAALAGGLWSVLAQEAPSTGVQVHVVVTVETVGRPGFASGTTDDPDCAAPH